MPSPTLPEMSAPAGDSGVRVGRADLHRSHNMRHYRGCWWCCACGFYCTTTGQRSSPKKLRGPCGRPTKASREYLCRLAKGLPPKGGIEWPARLPSDMALQGLRAVPATRLSAKTRLDLATLWARPQDLAEQLYRAAGPDGASGDSEAEDDPFGYGPAGFGEA